MITLTYESHEKAVSLVLDESVRTWPELSEEWLCFLRAIGYVIDYDLGEDGLADVE